MPLSTKEELKSMVAEGELPDVLQGLRSYAHTFALPEVEERVLLLSGQFATYKEERQLGTLPSEDLQALHTQISRGLLELIKQLPESPQEDTAPPKQRGIPEQRFKLRIALLMIVTKVVVIGWVLFHMRRGVSYFLDGPAAIGILLPVFSAYMTAIWDDLLHARYVDDAQKPQRYIRKPLLYVAYFVFPIYIIALIIIINLKITGHIESLSTYFAMIETALGVYIGRMITVVFGKSKNSN